MQQCLESIIFCKRVLQKDAKLRMDDFIRIMPQISRFDEVLPFK